MHVICVHIKNNVANITKYHLNICVRIYYNNTNIVIIIIIEFTRLLPTLLFNIDC